MGIIVYSLLWGNAGFISSAVGCREPKNVEVSARALDF